VFVEGEQHPYDDSLFQSGSLYRRPGSIEVPVFGCFTWQDDEISSRAAEWFASLDQRRTWVVGANGYHTMCDRPAEVSLNDDVVRFFDRYVKGVANGWERTPHVRLWHDTGNHGAPARAVPSWVTTYPAWPPEIRPVALTLQSHNRLDQRPAQSTSAPDNYDYPLAGSSTEDGVIAGQTNRLWKQPGPSNGEVAFTTPALTKDAETLGPARADLWVSSTATDTDLQATITDVRPDGQEVYIARGWLRASHRKLDQTLSTPVRPYQTHIAQDAAPLVPNQPTLMSLEILPFDYVFRAGSRIRLQIDAPVGETGGWSFSYLTTPATNTIWHDAEHPSRLVLGLLPGAQADKPAPPCDTLLNQPCRANALSLPDGTLDLQRLQAASTPGSPVKACQSHRKVTITLPHTRRSKVLSVLVTSKGRTLRALKGAALTRRRLTLSFFGLPKVPVTVRIRIRSRGHILTRRIVFHPCTKAFRH
jgi:putative CocE/NonD family hydrolase